MNRVLIYVHYNKNNELSEHIVYQLAKIKPLFNKILFISNSKINADDRKHIEKLCDRFIQRENAGFDFGAWRDGISFIGWNKLSNYDSMTLMNDTCFGPIYPIDTIYKEMELQHVDFWGITDHVPSPDGMPGTNGPVPYHLQSYLTVFNRNVIKSAVFQKFWRNVSDYKEVDRVIQKYETQLTRILNNSNFISNSYFNTKNYSIRYKISAHNYAELNPLILLKNRTPLLKVKAFKHTPTSLIKREITRTDYPFSLAIDYLSSMNMRTESFVRYRLKRLRDLFIDIVRIIYNK